MKILNDGVWDRHPITSREIRVGDVLENPLTLNLHGRGKVVSIDIVELQQTDRSGLYIE